MPQRSLAVEDGLEQGETAGWEKASARLPERHTRRPDPGRWMDERLLLRVKSAGRRGQMVYLLRAETESAGWIPWPHG